MEKTARAVIFDDNDNLILIKRENKPNSKHKLFYCFPGGHLEKGETYEDACIREVEEELGIKVTIEKLLYEIENTDINKFEKFYICKYISGILGTGTGEEFTKRNEEKYGKYQIEKISIKKIQEINLLPEDVKNVLI